MSLIVDLPRKIAYIASERSLVSVRELQGLLIHPLILFLVEFDESLKKVPLKNRIFPVTLPRHKIMRHVGTVNHRPERSPKFKWGPSSNFSGLIFVYFCCIEKFSSTYKCISFV